MIALRRWGGEYKEVGSQCPRFRYVQRVGASNGGYSRACPIPHQFTLPTLCQPKLCGVNGFAGAVSVCLCQVDCSQMIVGGGKVMDYHIPRRPLGVRNPCVLCGGWSMAFPIDIEVFADDTHHVPLSVLLRMALSIPYIRLLSLRMVSFVRGANTYAMSRAQWRTWTGFPLHRLCPTFVSWQLSRRPSVRQMSTFSQGDVPYFLGLCRVKPIHFVLSVAGGLFCEHEMWHLSI